MLRRMLFALLLLAFVTPLLAQDVPINHPNLKNPPKGLYLDGKAYVPIEVVNQLLPNTFVWDSSHRMIVSPSLNMADRKPILFVGDKESAILTALKAQGIRAEQSRVLPTQFGPYSAVVIEDENACRKANPAQIDKYLRTGGGMVLIDRVPYRLLSGGPGWPEISKEHEMAVAKWLGASWVQTRGIGNRELLKSGARIATGHPFGTEFRESQVVWSFPGDADIACVESSGLSAEAIPIATMQVGQRSSPRHFAFAHAYGQGRVYWQSIADDPGHPKLMDLFIGGVKWAGGFIKDI